MKDKKCGKCGVVKSADNFYRNSWRLSGWCKECAKERSREQAKSGYFRKLRESRRGPNDRHKLSSIERIVSDMWGNCKKRAVRSGFGFDLNKDDLIVMVGAFCDKNYYQVGPKSPFKPSIDRIDSSIGYLMNNIRIVWLIENYAKNSFSEEIVIEFCKRKLGLL